MMDVDQREKNIKMSSDIFSENKVIEKKQPPNLKMVKKKKYIFRNYQ